jgi:hypothetical protein
MILHSKNKMAITADARLPEILRMLNSPSMKSNTIETDGITTWTINRKNKLNTTITYNKYLEEWTITVPNGLFLNYFDIYKQHGKTMLFIDDDSWEKFPIKNLSLEEYLSKRTEFTISLNAESNLVSFHGKDITKFIVYGYLFPKKS